MKPPVIHPPPTPLKLPTSPGSGSPPVAISPGAGSTVVPGTFVPFTQSTPAGTFRIDPHIYMPAGFSGGFSPVIGSGNQRGFVSRSGTMDFGSGIGAGAGAVGAALANAGGQAGVAIGQGLSAFGQGLGAALRGIFGGFPPP